ncbi:WD40 repeat [Ostreococcus tauri]|uniref:WD40 repeat n=1 Tax=Ostreococcus tauri TaxID=70448 RepID=A0A090N4Y1_OSTTA|nr:WD40 repeat [Ostreococcus tauri]CEG01596.1 WD40 repeat [Ostreococcus tauri]|eukprot:XP_022841053.1 WD40 repeat [Ostreococcus tauri]
MGFLATVQKILSPSAKANSTMTPTGDDVPTMDAKRARVTSARTRNETPVKTEMAEGGVENVKEELEAAADDDDVGEDGLTAFEREREALIKRNKARMEALNISTLSADVGGRAKGPAPSSRGIGSKRRREAKEPVEPTRRSSRARKIAPELASGVAYERRDGSVVLADGATYRPDGSYAEPPVKTRPSGEVKLESENGSEKTDAAFVEELRTKMGAFVETKARGITASVREMVKNKLTLREEDVAKCVPKGVTHLDFSHDESMLLVASGDKEGHIGLWRVDKQAKENDEDDDDVVDDGVLYYKAHGNYISHCKWGHGALRGKLFTCAYDGAVRVLDPQTGSFAETLYSEEDEFSACDQFSHGNNALVCDNVGNLHQVDLRAGKFTAKSLSIHEKKINTVHIDPGNENRFATSTNQLVSVWDVRKLTKNAKAVHEIPHSKSSQAAYWCPDGSGALLTTCYDDALRVWNPDQDVNNPSALIRHNNQTGRWVLPFRAVWSAAGDGVLCGSMQRHVEIFNPKSGASVAKYSSPDHMTAIASRLACHRTLNYVAAGTASGRVHVYRADGR